MSMTPKMKQITDNMFDWEALTPEQAQRSKEQLKLLLNIAKQGSKVKELQARNAELEARERQLVKALSWIARVNAMDYEYQDVANKALQKLKEVEGV